MDLKLINLVIKIITWDGSDRGVVIEVGVEDRTVGITTA